MEDFAPGEEGGVYGDSAIDPAMKNAFTQTRKWMMAKYSLSEFETWTIIAQAVNFGMTQLVDGNWGMHALIPKSIFEGVERNPKCGVPEESANIPEGGGGTAEQADDLVSGYGDADAIQESATVSLALAVIFGMLFYSTLN